MGRWAQRRVRGGGGVPNTPPPTIFITDVIVTGSSTCDVNFSDSVTGADVGLWAGFTVNGQQPNTVDFPGGPVASLGFSEGIGEGQPWEVTAQPQWLTTPIVVPESGVTAGP